METLEENHRTLAAPGGQFEVERVEIRGVPTLTWKHAPTTLHQVLDTSRAHGDRMFLVHYDQRVTFAEHYELVSGLAHYMIDELGVRKGDRVAIAARNCPEWSIVFWATVAAGAIVVALNAWWTGEELLFGLCDSGATVLFADGERLERLGSLLEQSQVRHTIGIEIQGSVVETVPAGYPTLASILQSIPRGTERPEVEVDPEDDATIFYTSGTTGKPKGAIGTHRNLASVPFTSAFLGARAQLRAGIVPDEAAPPPQPAGLLTTPLFHVTACHANLVVNTFLGGKLAMMRKWDPEEALELIERERLTGIGGVPTMVRQLLDSPSFASRDTSSLTRVGTGGAPAPPEQARRVRRHLPGATPGNAWGMTETSSVATSISGADYDAHPDSSGAPPPVCELKIIDESGRELPRGEVGELLVRGPNVIRGYWNRPDETARTVVDGWLRTGDLARIDEDGWVYIVDRAKDIIIRGGENIASVEVESALFEIPDVVDAAAIPIPHDVLGEEVGAVVQLAPGSSLTEDDIREALRTHLAAFKVPVRIWSWPEPLPRNAAGKVLKRDLQRAVGETA